MKHYLHIAILTLMLIPRAMQGQVFTPKVKAYTREGNKAYEDDSFVDAEVAYKKALEAEAADFKARFNLGNSLYKQERFDDAIKQYQQAAGLGEDKMAQALAYHNLGNAFLQKKELKKSIAAYKNALRRNPMDADTRFNLAYALQQMKDNPQQNQDQNDLKPSEFAKRLKKQADGMVGQRRYLSAFNLMKEGLKKDETVAYYNDFIGRLQEIVGVSPTNE